MAFGAKCDKKGCNNFGDSNTGPDGRMQRSGDWVEIYGPVGVHHACSYEHAAAVAAELFKVHEKNKKDSEDHAQKIQADIIRSEEERAGQ